MPFYIRYLFMIVCFLVASSADATTFYVGTGGSDGNSCTTAQTIGTPKRNIAGPSGGLECLRLNPLSNRLEIRAGTYSEQINSNNQIIPTGTSWTNAPVIANYNNETVTLNPGSSTIFNLPHPYIQYVIFSGFILDGASSSENAISSGTSGAHHIRFQNMEVKNTLGNGIFGGRTSAGAGGSSEYLNLHIHDTGLANRGHGIYLAASNNLIEGCNIHNNAKFGIQIYDTPGTGVNNNIVRRNLVYNHLNSAFSPSGIIISSGNGNIAHNNIVYNNIYGITVGNQAIGNKVYNNTVYSNTVGINTGGNTSSWDIRNNIVYSNGTSTSFTGSGTQSNNPTTDPSFVNAAGINFALQAGSTAINAGVAINGFNFNGSAPDVGAHETIAFASAKILNDATDNKAEITFENNVFPPLLPATGCLGFTARKNAANNAVNSCVRSAAGVVTLTLTSSYINTDTADFSYTTTSGNVSDSALIGGTKNQRLNAVGSPNQSVDTSTLAGGGTLPFLEQIEYQFESPGGTESLPNYRASLNVGIPLPPDKCTVIRPQIVNTVASINSAGYAPFAQRNGAGGYVAIANGPTPSLGISFISGTGLTMPERVTGPTTDQISRAGTFVPGGVQTSSAETPTVALTTAAPRTQLVAALCVGAGNVAGDYFDVRWYRAGIPLDLYTQTPRITISEHTGRFGNP